MVEILLATKTFFLIFKKKERKFSVIIKRKLLPRSGSSLEVVEPNLMLATRQNENMKINVK